MTVILGRIVRELTPLDEQHPWKVSGCLTVGMTHGGIHLFFLDNRLSRYPKESEGGFIRENNFAPFFCCTFFRIVCP